MFKARLQRMLNRRGDEFAQSAIAFPMVVLLLIALFNMSIAGFASVNAANAANHGARVGSVYQQNAAGAAYAAAAESIAHAPVGDYQISVSGGGFPGATIVVTVEWSVPNYIAPIISFFGGSMGDLSGTSSATFRQEGW
jgi:Flp pilus assembly protein TadG